MKDLTKEDLLYIRAGLQALMREYVKDKPVNGTILEKIKDLDTRVIREVRGQHHNKS